MKKEKVYIGCGKKRLQHNDEPILSLGSPNKLYITFIFYFVVIMFTLCPDLIKN